MSLKGVFILLTIVATVGCNQTIESKKVENLNENYIPDLGSIMLTIQAHHTKLYYAGREKNWELASFFAHELEESFEDVEKYHAKHDGVNLEGLVKEIAFPAIRKMESTLKISNDRNFENSFIQLTNACNNCHASSGHSFIKVKTPQLGDFLNQDFTN